MNIRQILPWILALLLTPVAVLTAIRPALGVPVSVGLLLLWWMGSIVRDPWRAVWGALLFYPVFPVIRSFILMYMKLSVPMIRFWPELLLAAGFAGLMLRRTHRPRWGNDDLPVFCFLLMGAYGLCLSAATQHPLVPIYGFHFTLVPALFYVVVRAYRPSHQQTTQLLVLWVASYVVLALLSVADYFIRPAFTAVLAEGARPEVSQYLLATDKVELWRSYMRMQGLIFEENVWGTLSGLAAFFGLSMIMVQRRLRWWGLLVVLGLSCLAFSVSRGSVVGWVAGFLVLFPLRQRYSWRLILAVILVVASIGGIFLYLANDPRVTFWMQMIDASGVGTDKFAVDRAHQWKKGWDVFVRNPSGTGLGTVGIAASYTGSLQTLVADGAFVASLAEVGIPGCLLLAACTIGIVWVVGRQLHATKNLLTRALGLTLLAQLVAFLVHAVSACMLEYAYVGPLYWILLGLFVARREWEEGFPHLYNKPVRETQQIAKTTPRRESLRPYQ